MCCACGLCIALYFLFDNPSNGKQTLSTVRQLAGRHVMFFQTCMRSRQACKESPDLKVVFAMGSATANVNSCIASVPVIDSSQEAQINHVYMKLETHQCEHGILYSQLLCAANCSSQSMLSQSACTLLHVYCYMYTLLANVCSASVTVTTYLQCAVQTLFYQLCSTCEAACNRNVSFADMSH